MVVLINHTPIISVPQSTGAFYDKFPSIVEKGSAFVKQSPVSVQKEFCLYVAQGEFGVVPATDPKIRYIGSDDATTCHIVILRHSSGTVCVAHFDGSKNEDEAVECMVSKISLIEGSVGSLELYVIGGYVPEDGSKEAHKNEAEHLSIKILGLFMKHQCQFHIALWCTCSLNTVQGSDGPQPTVYGAAVNISSGAVFPATFKSHDPDLPLRSASRWMSENARSRDLYDHRTGTISINPFHYSDVHCFSFYVKLPNDVLLNNFSTSPKVEPPTFCQDLREVFKVFVMHPNPGATLFPKNKPKRYSLDDSGMWKIIQEWVSSAE